MECPDGLVVSAQSSAINAGQTARRTEERNSALNQAMMRHQRNECPISHQHRPSGTAGPQAPILRTARRIFDFSNSRGKCPRQAGGEFAGDANRLVGALLFPFTLVVGLKGDLTFQQQLPRTVVEGEQSSVMTDE